MNNLYQKVFKRIVDKDSIVDLLKLKNHYVNFLETKLKKDAFTDTNQENVATNGRLTILAVLGFLIKYKRNLVNLKMIPNIDDWEIELQQDNIKGN